MKSSIKAYHGRKKENFACGQGLLVHFQNRFRVSILSLGVVELLAPIFHFLAITRFGSMLVART